MLPSAAAVSGGRTGAVPVALGRAAADFTAGTPVLGSAALAAAWSEVTPPLRMCGAENCNGSKYPVSSTRARRSSRVSTSAILPCVLSITTCAGRLTCCGGELGHPRHAGDTQGSQRWLAYSPHPLAPLAAHPAAHYYSGSAQPRQIQWRFILRFMPAHGAHQVPQPNLQVCL